jgi:2-oxo-4-hydroxy-4-carboxy-5-ureidoimidazoline decarboxylase
MKLDDVNGLSLHAFEAHFGDVAEHSPWVARQAALARPFASRDAMIAAFISAVSAASRDAQLALVRAHPDLAKKAKLTDDSTREQAGAGLNSLTPVELEHFTQLNDLYNSRFGFPFIFAVKGATKHRILAGFEERLNRPPDHEFATAIAQVCRILRFRIEDRVLS